MSSTNHIKHNEPEDTDNEEEEEPKGGERVQREWLTPTEAMQYLGVSRATLYKLMDSGQLKFYVLRGVQKRRLRKEDLDLMFEEGGPGQIREEEEQEQPKSKRKKRTKK